jgi:D-arabinose 1-dehydrogenase-like Zn-dependent alcohol dehydrogenase
MTTTMKAAQISKPRGEWELVERVIPEPRAGQVRVKVDACGICHSDVFVKDGLWPGMQYPRVPGHEVAGRIDAVGDVTVQVVKTGITPPLAPSDRLREAKTEPLHPAGRLHMLQ